MYSKPGWRRLVPRYEVPPLAPMSIREKIALLIGTGLGSGFIKPMAPSWGSIPGFLYFVLVARLPRAAAIAIFLALLLPAVWSGTICERLLGGKDPRPVVIDEIAAVPFALWPLWLHWPEHLLTWAILFAAYRFADFLKPWPANRLQSVRGGLGILIDDLISAGYVGIALLIVVRAYPGLL
jgi:phosphatidylglycerophosphatase A